MMTVSKKKAVIVFFCFASGKKEKKKLFFELELKDKEITFLDLHAESMLSPC